MPISTLSRFVFLGITVLMATNCVPSDATPAAISESGISAENAGLVILRPDDVEYIPLNPARGDAAPQAGVLWGDIRRNEASGTLLRFADGFSSPPHIHNITYRAIVIEGDIFNGPPDKPKNWMGPGSFWVQAAGENHVTAAKDGSSSLAFLEILSGPYLVEPSEDSFASSDVSVNINAGEIDWSSGDGLTWARTEGDESKFEFAHLWGNPNAGDPNGRLIRFEQEAVTTLIFENSPLRAVVIQGAVEHEIIGVSKNVALYAGGFFKTNAAIKNQLTCLTNSCVIYLRTS